MSEPQLERMFSRLANANFTPDLLGMEKDLLEDIIWYCCDAGRAENTAKSLKSLPPDKQKTIIGRLGSLYPLSRPVLMRILREIDYADEYFCLGMDPNQEFLGMIKGILSEMNKAGRLTTRTMEYAKEYDRLRKEAEKLQPLVLEKKQKEEELARARAEADRKGLEKELEAVENEINEIFVRRENLEKDLEEKKKRRMELIEEEQKLKRELAALEADADPNRMELLRKLFETFPPDIEEK